jgi:hypothetical protein
MNYQPKRTEYRGIVFDSKSEAVFARTLDIAGIEWDYHENHCGHEWDFYLKESGPLKRFTLVEYKPSPPTGTYIKWLTEKMRDDPVESLIVWGNPWAGDLVRKWLGYTSCCYVTYPIFTDTAKHGWGDFEQDADNGEDIPFSYRHTTANIFGITSDMVEKAMRYRFDLRSQGRFK